MASDVPLCHTLETLHSTFAIARLSPGAGLPWWAARGGEFLTFTRTPDETSIVCEERCIPEDFAVEGPFRALRIEGVMPFQSTGVLVSIAAPLAAARVPIFVVSTYDTDYILVPDDRLLRAIEALREAGHAVRDSENA